FFSSRRRHTRSKRDWSSDVCSSDLQQKMPRLVAVQAEGCAPIVKAWEEGKRESEFWKDSETVAFGINVPKALGDFLVLDALYDKIGRASCRERELISVVVD